MRPLLPQRIYLCDASSLINLTVGSGAIVKTRFLTRIQGRLKIPDVVVRELLRRDDPLRRWIQAHRRDCEVQARTENIGELARIGQQYRDLLTMKRNAADPVICAMAVYYAEWLLLTDDGGIQAVCVQEGIPYATTQAFRALEYLTDPSRVLKNRL